MDFLKQSWRLWFFVFFLNLVAFIGAFYLHSVGIDLKAFRGVS